jgi:addiction module HigA family antidote
MPEKFKNEYAPDVVTYPGETLLEILEDREMSQAELAERMGRPKKTINEIVNGKAEITPQTAIQLERVLGVAASFWNNLESHYREYAARQAEREHLRTHQSWPACFPIRQMARLGWIERKPDKADQVAELLSFFAVSSIEQWKGRYKEEAAAFRLPRTFDPDIYALTAWLRQGERAAQDIECQPFNLGAFNEMLERARSLTREGDPKVFIPQLGSLGMQCGVAIVFVPELTQSRACGATRWLSPGKALIQLSLRYKTNDHLWFTFFHEAAHIVLHGKRQTFVELGRTTSRETVEQEANGFAADHLIPPRKLEQLLLDKPLTHDKLTRFAEHINIAPGIVAGRLQHDEEIPFTHFNNLKISYRWEHESDY